MLDSRLVLNVCAAILAVAATPVALPGRTQAAEPRVRAVVVAHGDGTRVWTTEVMRFAQLPDPRDRPDIRAGQTGSEVPPDATLVWFGDLSHEGGELQGVPEDLARVDAELGREVVDTSAFLAVCAVRLGANCYIRNVDRADRLPQTAMNFSGSEI